MQSKIIRPLEMSLARAYELWDQDWDNYRRLFQTGSIKFNCVFIHITKVAGTSIVKTIEKHDGAFLKSPLIDLYADTRYFKFCFVRNPWDRLVSAYYQFIKSKTEDHHIINKDWNKSFDHFLSEIVFNGDHFENWLKDKKGTYDLWFPYSRFIGPPDNRCVDFIGRFENLQEDWAYVVNKIGLPKQPLMHEWHTIANNRSHYQNYYNDHTRKLVADFYAEDIEVFKYTY